MRERCRIIQGDALTELPIMDSYDLAVIEAAEAYVDQLCSFNSLTHPEVQRRRRELARAVDRRYHKPVKKSP